MPRYLPVKQAFVAGEISPRMKGRDDLEQYHQGLMLCENFIVLPHGGCMRRSGSRFVAQTKDMTKRVRLIQFEVSTSQAYVCEFGHLYVRFYANEGRLEVATVPVEVVSPYTESDLAGLHFTQDQDVMWIEHENHAEHTLSRLSATSFNLAKVVYRDGKAPMRPDNLTVTTLTVTGAANPRTFTFSTNIGLTAGADVGRGIRFKTGEWYQITGVTSGSVATGNSISGTPTLGAADANWALGMFSDTEGARSVCFHEGRRVALGSRTVVNWYAISQSDDFDNFMTGTVADEAILKRLTAGKTNAIQWGASADEVLVIGTSGTEFRVTAQGDDILTPTSTKSKPSTSRGSAHIQPIALDSEVLFIQRGGKKLRVLTYDLQKDGRIARDVSILAEHVLNSGAAELHYQQSPDSVVWCVLGDGQLAGFTYEREQKVNGAHRQILGGGFGSGEAVVESIAVIPTPDNSSDQLWLAVKRTVNGATVRYIEFLTQPFRPGLDIDAVAGKRSRAMENTPFSDCSLTLDAPKAISAITKANPGVFTSTTHGFANGDTVKLRDIDSFSGTTAAPSMTTLNNIAYTVANATADTFTLLGPSGAAVDTTSYRTYIGAGTARKETATITGLGHLEGQLVAVQADGAAHPPKTVTGGSIVLDYKASIVHAGLAYISRFETMPFVAGDRTNTNQGKPQRVQRIVARVLESLGGEWRQGHNPAKELEFKPVHTDDEATDTAPPFLTGDYELSPQGGWDEEPTVYCEQSEPLPLTVLSLMIWADSRER